jgi:hypothetical protein
MVQQLLPREACAKCRGCCVFDEYDRWESPEELTATLTPGLYTCVHLGKNGCELGESKPAECAMYPFRIMRIGDSLAITVAKFCKPVTDLPLTRLLQFADEKQEQFLSTDIIKDYNNEYVVLKIIT